MTKTRAAMSALLKLIWVLLCALPRPSAATDISNVVIVVKKTKEQAKIVSAFCAADRDCGKIQYKDAASFPQTGNDSSAAPGKNSTDHQRPGAGDVHRNKSNRVRTIDAFSSVFVLVFVLILVPVLLTVA